MRVFFGTISPIILHDSIVTIPILLYSDSLEFGKRNLVNSHLRYQS